MKTIKNFLVYTFLMCALLLTSGFSIASPKIDFEEVMIQSELNPQSVISAKAKAIQMNLPVSIITKSMVRYDVMWVENEKPVYAVITNFADIYNGGYTAFYEEVADNFKSSEARIDFGNGNIKDNTNGFFDPVYSDNSAVKKYLMIPNWTNKTVYLFNASNGDLVNNSLIPTATPQLSSPKHAISHYNGDDILVSDQITDLVQKFNSNGFYSGAYAPSGGVNNSILDNIRGIRYRTNNNLLVTVGSGTNANTIQQFDQSGNHLGSFIGSTNLSSPFDILLRQNDMLISNSSGANRITRFDHNGNFLSVFSSSTSFAFPQQMIELPNGNVIVAGFSSPSGLIVLSSSGTFIKSLVGVTGNRGVYLLDNGNYLTTNSTGVHEIDSASGSLVRSVLLITNMQYISEYGIPDVKFYEHFSDEKFPQEGWSKINMVSGGGDWDITSYNVKTIPGAAISGSSILGTNNYLITERFTPYNGDSLVFYFRQSSSTIYNDSVDVRISTTDSLVPSFTSRLLLLKDGVNYPAAGTYGKFGVNLSAYAGQNCWITFHHSSSGLDTVMLDDIRVGTPLANYVNVDLITHPIEEANAGDTLVPSAIIINEGFNNQTLPMAITLEITGPHNYTSTKYDTIAVGKGKEIFFDSVATLIDTGAYNITVYTSYESQTDGTGGGNIIQKKKKGKLKSILKNIFTENGRKGSNGCLYHFKTSEANHQPKPGYYWKPTDTQYEIELIKDGQDVSGGLYHHYSNSGLNDGFFKIEGALQGKEIRLCAASFTTFYISTNGVIGLGGQTEPPEMNINNNKTHQYPSIKDPITTSLYPLWMDLDFGLQSGYSSNRLSYRVINYTNQTSVLVISYDKVRVRSKGYYVSFQVCIELKNQGSSENSNVRYSYADDALTASPHTSSAFLEDYRNFWFGDLKDHIVGFSGTGEDNFYYRFRITPPTTTIRRSRDGRLFDGRNSLAMEFGMYENICKVCDQNPNGEDALGICNTANLKVLKQGFYNGSNNVRDTFTVYLRNCTAPYAIVDTVKAYSDASGNLVCKFCKAASTGCYYIVIKSRNSLETWSKSGGVNFTNGTANYDFTTALAQAYGSNMILVGGKSCIFTGDVIQDGSINLTDLLGVYNDGNNFATGYKITDLNGDNLVDLADIVIGFNNAQNFVQVMKP